jgi:sensor histidine kinase YesM
MESKIITQASKPFRINDLKARLIGIPFIALVMHIAFSKAQGQDIARLDGFFMAFLNTITYWEGLRLIWMNLQQKMPHYSQTKKRIIVLITSVLIYGILATVIIKYTEHFLLGNSCTIEEIINGYFLGLIPTTLVMIVYEAVYFFHSWKEKVIEAETLARTQLVSQLEALKSQLDPHFLFNSLNTLSSLIDENEPAQQYLSRLADVYRYVLLSKDKDTVTLREEMEFVESFLYLAKVRFRQGLEIKKSISEDQLSHKVAPLGVQLLVENALKHNVITQSEPLQIEIAVEDDYLWVKNEIRPKVHFETSTKLGLKNILERYKILTNRPVEIFNDQIRFEVALPLLSS